MKITTVKLCVALLVATALLSFVVATSPKGRHHGPSFEHQGRGFPPLWVVEEVLELTEEQVSKIKGFQKEVRTQVKSIREDGRELRRKIRAELDQEEPSPVRVGELVISGHGIRKQAQEIRQSVWESFQSILTPEQLEKVKELKELKSRLRKNDPHRGGHRGFFGGGEPFLRKRVLKHQPINFRASMVTFNSPWRCPTCAWI